MYRCIAMGLVTTAWMIAWQSPSVHGQRPYLGPGSGIIGARGELGSRISGERTTRQVEVYRLQESIDRLASRLERLERQTFSSASFPAFTVEESEAELAYAEARLAARRQDLDNGEASEVDVAGDRLQVVRARSRLMLARAAHADAKLALEAEIVHARRKLIEETQQEQQMQRLAAKGLTSSSGLDLQSVDVELAKQALLRLQTRLQVYESLDSVPADKSTDDGGQ